MTADSRRAEPLVPPKWMKEWDNRKLVLYPNQVVHLTLWGRVRAGRETVEMARALAEAVDECEHARLYVHLGEMTAYDTQVRVVCTEVLRVRYAQIEELVVYAESSLAKMGVSVARLALPKLMSVGLEEFDTRLRRRLAGR